MRPMAEATFPVAAIACGTLLIGGAIGGAIGLWLGSRDSGAAATAAGDGPPPAVVEAHPVQIGTLAIAYETLGTLRAPERVELRPVEAGQIVAIGFGDGDQVEAGQVLVELEASRERAALDEAIALRDEARRQFELATNLVERGSGTENELARTRNALAAAEARVALAQGELDRLRIVAPFAGKVTRKLVTVGATIGPADSVAVLTAVDPLRVSAGIPESYLGRIREDLALRASTPAFPDREFGGRVVYVSPEVDPTTRSVLVEAEIDNPDGLLRPGQSLSVAATVGTVDDALTVPEQALIHEGDRISVYVVEEGKALRRDVTLGERGEGRVVVTEGLEAGDLVVTTGIQKIFFPGMPVQIRNQAAAEGESEGESRPATASGGQE